jgi:hypothetical protein
MAPNILTISTGFRDNTILKNLVLPVGVEHVAVEAFRGSSADITFAPGSKLRSIQQGFAEMVGGSVVLPRGLEAVTEFAFWKSKARVSFEEGSALKTIYRAAFQDSNISKISIPLGVKVIDRSAFINSKFTDISMSNLLNTGATAQYGFSQTQ